MTTNVPERPERSERTIERMATAIFGNDGSNGLVARVRGLEERTVGQGDLLSSIGERVDEIYRAVLGLSAGEKARERVRTAWFGPSVAVIQGLVLAWLVWRIGIG